MSSYPVQIPNVMLLLYPIIQLSKSVEPVLAAYLSRNLADIDAPVGLVFILIFVSKILVSASDKI